MIQESNTARVRIQLITSLVIGCLASIRPAFADTKASEQKQTAHSKQAQALYLLKVQLARHEMTGNVSRARMLLNECPKELRNWEWHYANRQCNPGLVSFEDNLPGDAVFSNDGKWIASSDIRGVKIWEADTRKMIRQLKGGRMASCVVFSPDGKRIAAGGFKSFVIWNAKSGEVKRTIEAHQFQVSSLAFSPDGDRIVSSGGVPHGGGRKAIGEIKVWDTDSGQKLTEITDTHFVNSVAFHPDGKRIASGSGPLYIVGGGGPGDLKIWDADSGKELLKFVGHPAWITAVSFSPNGKLLASASADKTARIWDADTGKQLNLLDGHEKWVRDVEFSLDGLRLVTAGDDQKIILRDAHGGKLKTMSGHAAGIGKIAFSPDGGRLVSVEGRNQRRPQRGKAPVGEVIVWDLSGNSGSRTLRGSHSSVSQIAISPNGKYLASTGSLKMIIRDARSGEVLTTIDRVRGEIAFGPNSEVVAAVDGAKGIAVWNVATGEKLRSIQAKLHPYKSIYGISISPDGRRIAMAAHDQFRVWNRATGAELMAFQPGVLSNHVTAVAYSPDGLKMATANWGGYYSQPGGKTKWEPGRVKVWNSKTGKMLTSLTGGGRGLAFSADGTMIASGDWDGSAYVWSSMTGKLINKLNGHSEGVIGVAFTPDGKRLATAGRDHTLKVWDISLGLEAISFRSHEGIVTSVAFDPEGHRLYSGSEDGTVKIWDATPRGEPSKK